ncbi:protein YdgV [Enterobacter cancerogenus]|uniref:protein YdgV n=1 Tax=Enterobacter cancerogenus TaxID=69218 RepID=UPI000B49E35B
MFNYRGQFSSAKTRSNNADNCNIMDNLFRTYFSKNTVVISSSFCLLFGEQHWHTAL